MSLEKAIASGKEHRRRYYGSKVWDCNCRNHGSCGYCESNRTIFDKRARLRVEGQEDEYFGHSFLPDPEDALQAEAECFYRSMGIDPNDWDLLAELGELYKG